MSVPWSLFFLGFTRDNTRFSNFILFQVYRNKPIDCYVIHFPSDLEKTISLLWFPFKGKMQILFSIFGLLCLPIWSFFLNEALSTSFSEWVFHSGINFTIYLSVKCSIVHIATPSGFQKHSCQSLFVSFAKLFSDKHPLIGWLSHKSQHFFTFQLLHNAWELWMIVHALGQAGPSHTQWMWGTTSSIKF